MLKKGRLVKSLLIGIVFFFCCISTAFALTLQDDGYAWNAATYEERLVVCKVLSSKIGKDYVWWFGALNSFYDSIDSGLLRTRVSEAASLLPFFE